MFQLFDSKDAVPEAQRAHAVETKDGKWAVPKAEEPLGTNGEKALNAERERRKEAERKVVEAQRALDDLKREQEAQQAKIPVDQLERWKQERDTAVAAEQAKTAAAEKKLEQFEIHRQFRDLATLPDVKVFMERLDEDNLAIMTRSLGLVDGKLVVLKDGKPTTDDPKAHIIGLKAARPYLFRGDGASGTGSEPSIDGGAPVDGAAAAVAAGKAAAATQKAAATAGALALR